MKKSIIISIIVVIILILFILFLLPKNNASNIEILEDYISTYKLCNSDKSYVIKRNNAYIHCIGEEGNIIKLSVDNGNVEKKIIEFDYTNTPNISQIHILVEDVDNDYIYLKSNVKNNDSIKDGEYVKCLFSTKVCEYYNKSEITTVENVSMSIASITPTGATIIIKDNNKPPYVYGSWYKIEKENNGEWFEVKTKTKDYYFNEIGYEVDKNGEVKFEINWDDLYGTLEPGIYRIVKEVESKYIWVSFGIDA